MTLDAKHLLFGLELAAAVTAGFVFFLAFILLAALSRLRARWQAYQPARVQLAGADPAAICRGLMEVLGPFGFQPSGVPGGAFTLEPSGFRRRSGATAISVVFPAEGGAVVTGQARYMAKLTADRKVWFLEEGAVPFWPWVRKRLLKTLLWIIAILFVAIFLVGISF